MSNLTEEQVIKRLKVESLQFLPKSKLPEFMSLIPEMDKETAANCVKQFPDFKEYSTSIVESYYDLCKEAIRGDAQSTIAACQDILEDLRSLLQRDNLSEDMQKYIADKMIEVAREIAEAEKEKRRFTTEVIRIGGAVGTFALAIGATLLGIKFKKR